MTSNIVTNNWITNDNSKDHDPERKEILTQDFEPEQKDEKPDIPLELLNERIDYDPFEITEGHVYLICGMTNSGKTELAFQIVKKNALKFHRIFMWSPTIDLQKCKILPKRYMSAEITEHNLEILLNYQMKNKDRGIKTLLLLDDVIGSTSGWIQSSVMGKIASSSRHYNLTTIIISQNLKILPPVIRDNCYAIFTTCLKEHQMNTMYSLQSTFKSQTEFKEYLQKHTNQLGKFVRFNLTADVKIRNYPFQTTKIPPFRIQF